MFLQTRANLLPGCEVLMCVVIVQMHTNIFALSEKDKRLVFTGAYKTESLELQRQKFILNGKRCFCSEI